MKNKTTATGAVATDPPEIRPGQSIELLKELHILTRDGKLNQDSRRKLKQFLLQNLYRHPQVSQTMAQAKQVISDLFACYLADPEQMQAGHASKLRASLGDLNSHDQAARVVADYIAGMTDRFATREHERLTGQRLFA